MLFKKIAFTFVQETFESSEASIWRVRSKVSPAFLTIVPEGLKLMSRSKKRGEGGEKMVQRADKGRNIPVVNHTTLHLAHSPAIAAY